MPKFHVLATKLVELRGTVQARDLKSARQNVLDYWYIHDTDENTITSGTGQLNAKDPVISEAQQNVRIIYIEDENKQRHKFGKELDKLKEKLKREGKWKEIK
jgi:hypothetical protein